MILMPPTVGPIFNPSALPIDAPTNPAMMLPITPPGMSLLMIKPAIQPRIPPTINVQSHPNIKIPPISSSYIK